MENPEWLAHLREEGYVVLSSVAKRRDVEVARALLWQSIESLWPDVSKCDASTWGQWPLAEHGIVPELSQSAGAWHIRGLARIREVFAQVWNENDLIVSMDSVICWRPWYHNSQWMPITEGLHLDQNPFDKPNFECVQGMLPLYPVRPDIGGLAVVPRSHLDHASWRQRYTHWRGMGDWCPLSSNDPLHKELSLLEADPGDLLLWDSRTVHGGIVAAETKAEAFLPPNCLARLSCTVAMVPRAKASLSVLKKRKEGFLRGVAFNSAAHEAGTSTGTLGGCFPAGYSYTPIQLSPSQLALL